jgi:hypothetical protein
MKERDPMLQDKANFADKEIAKKPHLIHEVKAIDNSNGEMAIYYVYVDPPHTAAFIEALSKGQDMNLEHYGKVLAACYGAEATPQVRDLLKSKYGVEV